MIISTSIGLTNIAFAFDNNHRDHHAFLFRRVVLAGKKLTCNATQMAGQGRIFPYQQIACFRRFVSGGFRILLREESNRENHLDLGILSNAVVAHVA